ncbi:hypothetical protein [Acinetobacter ursingii]|uniref:hypothetical protein n=1 Tax=Acinetobacter ursingii TaxID=108980 RepID=UPI003AF5E091
MKNLLEIQNLLKEIKVGIAWADQESIQASRSLDSHSYMRGYYQGTLESIKERVTKIEELIDEHS